MADESPATRQPKRRGAGKKRATAARRAITRPSRAATRAEQAVVREEEALLERVREALQQTASRPQRGRAAGGGEFESLREELFEARDDDVGLVLALMHQQAARDGSADVQSPPDLRAPYFGHLRVNTSGRRRDILLGPRAYPGLAGGVSIVDWRRAPIAEIFFTHQPGDDYELTAGSRLLEGVVKARRLLTFDEGKLESVTVEGGVLRRSRTGWRFEPRALEPLTGAPDASLAAQLVGAALSTGRAGIATELLDRQQRKALDQDPHQGLLVLGSAGCGKTTVALHRVARLCSRHPKQFPPWRTLVVVPERGLGRLSQRLLAELGLQDVAVHTFDQWVAAEVKKIFAWVPPRRPPTTPLAVSKLKRHPALLCAIDQLIDERAQQIARELDRRLRTGEVAQQAMAASADPVLANRLRRVGRELVKAVPKRSRKTVERELEQQRGLLYRVRDDFVRLIGDRALLELAMQESGGVLSDHHIEATIAHTSRQLDDPAERRYAHIQPERLKTVDGRGIDEGTPDELAHTVDAEDYAILLELLYRKTGKTPTGARGRRRVSHLVVDEAQEFAPIELRALGRALKGRGGTITVAGDAAQQIDPGSWFASWQDALAALGAADVASTCLETTYRCPRPVAELAHHVLGDLAPDTLPRCPRQGPPVSRSVVPSEGHAAVWIADVLNELGAAQPQASVAVIARHAESARALWRVLARSLAVRLVLTGEFEFAPGIEVTEVAQVKGLEFDYVVVPDATVGSYPDHPEARRALHVAVTRAAHQVWLVSPGTPSPLLPPE